MSIKMLSQIHTKQINKIKLLEFQVALFYWTVSGNIASITLPTTFRSFPSHGK